jgi:hypothetical protein
MVEISGRLYEERFRAIYEWYEKNVHGESEYYRYFENKIQGSHLRLIEITDSRTDNVLFRVLLKATSQAIDITMERETDEVEKDILLNTGTQNKVSKTTGYQVCFIELDRDANPRYGILYTYVPGDQNYKTISIGRKVDGNGC